MRATRYHNYHKHTHYSNIKTPDSITKPEEYILRAKELGCDTYFTGEHGFQGNIFEAKELCDKHGMKCVYSVEAYYVDDMFNKNDRAAYHIILVALTQKARKEINKIMSKANEDGFYYKPRIDLDCLLSLTPSETVVTTACVASRMFKPEWEEKFFKPVFNHFGKNFFLEVQPHIQKNQAIHNKEILKVSRKYGVKIIHANDSHYIHPEDSKYRDMFIKAKGIFYDDEDGFVLDYPDINTIYERYKKQGVLTEEEVTGALNNTLVFDKAESIEIDKEFKIPLINKDILKKELPYLKIDGMTDDEILRGIVKKAWGKEKKIVNPKRISEYKKAICYEMDIIEKCGMARYFIIDHIAVKRAVNVYHATMTRSGRGSAVSFYINRLLGLTEVDRIKAPITLYPTRFMSAERILSSRSLPDIDLNASSAEPLIKATEDILGKDGIKYMVAYKPLQEASAFRMWCKAKGLHVTEYDEVAKNLEEYADNPKWKDLIDGSKRFIGVIESIAPSSCSFLLLDRPISEEIGTLRVGNSKEYEICCALDGYYCDVFKYLKNDYLTVTVYEIIDRVFKLIEKPIDDIGTLVNNCKKDEKTWDIYAKGLTTTINQADSDYAKPMLKRYKPKSLAELSAWVAAIRPGFASLVNNFLDRKPYTTGVKELDNLLEDSFHYLIYQESIMKFLVWLSVEEKETYDIIKKISKKKFKEEELKELHSSLKQAWVKNVGVIDGFDETWRVVEDAAHYSFNASHSLSVAIDSLYGAYLKSHYPLEYFSVALSIYADDKERTANLVSELPHFGIELKPIKFGKSSADYVMDKKNNAIYKGVKSVKFCNSDIAGKLLEVSKKNPSDFIEALDFISKTSVDSRQLKILTRLNFFTMFGQNRRLMDIIDLYFGVKEKNKKILPSFRNCCQIKKDKIVDYERYGITEFLIKKHSKRETAEQYNEIDNVGLLKELIDKIPDKAFSMIDQIKFDKEYLTYTEYKNPKMSDIYYIVMEFKTYKDLAKPYLILRNLQTGEEIKTKIKKSSIFKNRPFGEYSVLKIEGFTESFKTKKTGEEYVVTDEREIVLEDYEVIK